MVTQSSHKMAKNPASGSHAELERCTVGVVESMAAATTAIVYVSLLFLMDLNFERGISTSREQKHCWCWGERERETTAQPPTVVCKMEAQSEHVRVAHTFFFARLGVNLLCSVGAC